MDTRCRYYRRGLQRKVIVDLEHVPVMVLPSPQSCADGTVYQRREEFLLSSAKPLPREWRLIVMRNTKLNCVAIYSIESLRVKGAGLLLMSQPEVSIVGLSVAQPGLT